MFYRLYFLMIILNIGTLSGLVAQSDVQFHVEGDIRIDGMRNILYPQPVMVDPTGKLHTNEEVLNHRIFYMDFRSVDLALRSSGLPPELDLRIIEPFVFSRYKFARLSKRDGTQGSNLIGEMIAPIHLANRVKVTGIGISYVYLGGQNDLLQIGIESEAHMVIEHLPMNTQILNNLLPAGSIVDNNGILSLTTGSDFFEISNLVIDNAQNIYNVVLSCNSCENLFLRSVNIQYEY